MRINVATIFDVYLDPYSGKELEEKGEGGGWEADSNYTCVGGLYKINGAKITINYTEENKKTYISNNVYECIEKFLNGRNY